MSNCQNCQKEIQNTEGKRPKKFCSDNCRASFHNKNKKKEPKYVLLSTHEAALERIKSLEAILAKKPSNDTQVSKPEESGRNDSQNKPHGEKHPLWKEGDPKEGSMAFYSKYDCFNYTELTNLSSTK